MAWLDIEPRMDEIGYGKNDKIAAETRKLFGAALDSFNCDCSDAKTKEGEINKAVDSVTSPEAREILRGNMKSVLATYKKLAATVRAERGLLSASTTPIAETSTSPNVELYSHFLSKQKATAPPSEGFITQQEIEADPKLQFALRMRERTKQF